MTDDPLTLTREAQILALAKRVIWLDGGDYSQVSQQLAQRVVELEREKADDAWHRGWKVAVKERDELREWQATVTVALRREGGAFFEDVPKHIRELNKRAEKAEATLQAIRALPRYSLREDVCGIASLLTSATGSWINYEQLARLLHEGTETPA